MKLLGGLRYVIYDADFFYTGPRYVLLYKVGKMQWQELLSVGVYDFIGCRVTRFFGDRGVG